MELSFPGISSEEGSLHVCSWRASYQNTVQMKGSQLSSLRPSLLTQGFISIPASSDSQFGCVVAEVGLNCNIISCFLLRETIQVFSSNQLVMFWFQTNLPIFKLKESTVRRRYSDFEWLRNELERESKVGKLKGRWSLCIDMQAVLILKCYLYVIKHMYHTKQMLQLNNFRVKIVSAFQQDLNIQC